MFAMFVLALLTFLKKK
ncbi:hypothetical protein [Effusibacillus lacus]|nr:hypothetical protein [Effusibacillus lacus]